MAEITPVLGDYGSIVQQITDEAQQEVDADNEEAAEDARRNTLLSYMIEAVYAVAAADGEVSEDECATLKINFSDATGEAVTPEQLDAFVDDAARLHAEQGVENRIQDTAGYITDPEVRRATLLLASAIAWRDGGVGQKQGLALQRLARAFDIEINELHKLMAKAKQQLR